MAPRRRWQRGGGAHTVRMPPRKGEEGFTLIELVIVLVILPLVMGAVAVVMLTSLENQQGIQNKLSDSSDATVSTAYYVRDVESAVAVTTTIAPSDRTFVCGENGTGLASGKSSFLLGLQLAGGSSVSYYEWAPRASTWPPPAGYVDRTGPPLLLELYGDVAGQSRDVAEHLGGQHGAGSYMPESAPREYAHRRDVHAGDRLDPDLCQCRTSPSESRRAVRPRPDRRARRISTPSSPHR